MSNVLANERNREALARQSVTETLLEPASTNWLEADLAIVERVRGGDREGFVVLMQRNNQRLFRVARAIGGNDVEAQDVVQQAYLSAYVHIDQFEGDAALSTWLVRIVINEAILRRRRAGRAFNRELDETHDISSSGWVADAPADTPEDEASRKEVVALLENAIDALPDAYRIAILLREVEGLSTREAAEYLDVSEEALRTRLHRARSLLRADLRHRIGGVEAREVFCFGGDRCAALAGRVLALLETRGFGNRAS